MHSDKISESKTHKNSTQLLVLCPVSLVRFITFMGRISGCSQRMKEVCYVGRKISSLHFADLSNASWTPPRGRHLTDLQNGSTWEHPGVPPAKQKDASVIIPWFCPCNPVIYRENQMDGRIDGWKNEIKLFVSIKANENIGLVIWNE